MLLQPKEAAQLPLQYYAEVTGAWTTRDRHVLQALEPLHVYAEGFLDARLKWRVREPLTLLELRCQRVVPPLLIPARERESYFGCFSWVELQPEDAAPLEHVQLRDVLSAQQFAEKQRLLREGLRQLQQAEDLDLSALAA
jgi:hypothetical protein